MSHSSSYPRAGGAGGPLLAADTTLVTSLAMREAERASSRARLPRTARHISSTSHIAFDRGQCSKTSRVRRVGARQAHRAGEGAGVVRLRGPGIRRVDLQPPGGPARHDRTLQAVRVHHLPGAPSPTKTTLCSEDGHGAVRAWTPAAPCPPLCSGRSRPGQGGAVRSPTAAHDPSAPRSALLGTWAPFEGAGAGHRGCRASGR